MINTFFRLITFILIMESISYLIHPQGILSQVKEILKI